MLGVRSRATLFLALIFLCGLLSGALGTKLVERMNVSADSSQSARSPQSGRAVARFTRDLSLNPLQIEQLTKILEETRGAYKQHELEIESIKQHGRARIREILTNEQKARFDQQLAERAEKDKQRDKH